MIDNAIRILLVEDNPGDARLLQGMLSDLDDVPFSVVHATRLNDAISLLTDEDFDAVILDLGLPDSNGLKTLLQAREPAVGSRVPIIVVTGDAESEHAYEARQNGASEFFAKNGLRSDALIRTLRHTIEQQQTRNHIEDADRLRQQFLANMSHELRTPLNSIIGFSDMMKLGVLGELHPAAYREYVDNINQCGTQLLSMIDDLLDLSKAEFRMMSVEESEFDLAALARSVAETFRPQANGSNIALGTDGIAGDVWLKGDYRMISHVLANLVANAINFTPEGGEVAIAVDTIRDGGVRLVVSDTGVGMSRDQLASAFDAYVHVEDPYSRSGGRGAGFGLALVKHFVELHGATIRLGSVEGAGTVATIDFPVERTAG